MLLCGLQCTEAKSRVSSSPPRIMLNSIIAVDKSVVLPTSILYFQDTLKRRRSLPNACSLRLTLVRRPVLDQISREASQVVLVAEGDMLELRQLPDALFQSWPIVPQRAPFRRAHVANIPQSLSEQSEVLLHCCMSGFSKSNSRRT